MAAIRIHDSVIALISGLSVAVANVRKPSVLKTFMVSQGRTECTDKKEDDSSCVASANNNNRILASAFSGRGRYFVVCDDRKFLHVYSTENEDWNLVNSHLLPRRATSVTFTLDESVVLVADKSGDVYSYAIAVPEARDCGEAQLLLGHLSMLLDMCLADNDKYIVTCDRDEKIRISCYPNAYNIHAYCLGHKEFVSSLVYIDDFKIIVSGSGDCSLCMWDMQGKLLCKAECLPLQASNSVTRLGKSSPGCENSNGDWNAALTSDIQHRPAIQCISYCRQCQLLAVSFHGFSKLMIYHLTTDNDDVAMTLIQTLELNVDPWDIKFDEQKNLWVLLPVEGSPLCVYQVDEDLTDQIQLRKCVDAISNITKLIETVNSKWDFFKDSLAVQSVVPKLWKICSQENVIEYQQRKKQRIGWQKGKNGEKEVAESQSQSAAVTGAERGNSPTGKMPRLS